MEHSTEHCGSESKVLRFLTEEQKNKVALLKMEMKIPGWRLK
jgi:hypothetical protein